MIKHLRSVVFGLLLALASPLAAFAQCSGQAPASTYCGNPTGALAIPGWKSLSGIPFPSIAGGTVVGNRTTGAATASALTNPILGIPGTSTGQLGLAGATSGTVTILPQAAAGTYNFNLPTGAGTAGQPLLSGGGGSSPMTFGALSAAGGGTGFSSYTLGDVLYANTTTTLAKLAGNTTTAKQYLSQTGTGAVSAAPAWATISGSDITGAALTKTDDTNVTLTLTGTPATALLQTVNIAVSWTSTLAVARGGTACGAASGTCVDNISGFASTGFIQRTGAGAYSFTAPEGILTNTRNAQTANYTMLTSDCGKTLMLGGTAFYTLTVNAASGYGATCAVKVVNSDTGRGKKMAINGITFPNSSILWPGQSFTLLNENNVWTVADAPGRWSLSASVQFEINSAGANTNDCLGTGAAGACATINGAITLAAAIVDARGQFVKFHTDCSGAPTTYSESVLLLNIVGAPSGYDPSSNKTPILSGDTTTPSNCIITSASNGTILAIGGVNFNIEGFQLKNTDGSSPCVLVDQNSFIRAGKMDFNSCNGASGNHIVTQYDSGYKAAVAYTISAAASSHVYSTNKGQFVSGGVAVDCSSGVFAFGGGFVYSERNSFQQWAGASFTNCGSVTGPRYTVKLGGGVDTNGGGASFFPGDSAGSQTNPGWYN